MKVVIKNELKKSNLELGDVVVIEDCGAYLVAQIDGKYTLFNLSTGYTFLTTQEDLDEIQSYLNYSGYNCQTFSKEHYQLTLDAKS